MNPQLDMKPRTAVRWTAQEDALLGAMPDKKLAHRLKRSYNAVATRRLNKGIPHCNPKRKSWRPEDDKVLGTRPDWQMAMLLKRSVTAVRNRRKKLGIPNKWAKKTAPGLQEKTNSWAASSTARLPGNWIALNTKSPAGA